METLKHLAHLLRSRKQQQSPSTLLLSSTISLNPAQLAYVREVENWQALHDWLSHMAFSDRKATLTYHFHLHQDMHQMGYRALAHCVQEGYFSTILTANLDSTLEDALAERNMIRSRDYQLFILDGHNDEQIAHALQVPSVRLRIIKVRGSLRDDILVTSFPDCFQFSDILRPALVRYLNGDTVIIGSLEQDDDLSHALGGRDGSVHYVLSHEPGPHDDVVKKMHMRGLKDPYTHIISGPDGDFEQFFQALETLLFPANTSSLTPIGTHALPARPPLPVSTGGTTQADVLLVTATEVETKAVLDLCPHTSFYKGDKTYFDLGVIGNARTVLVRSEMGSVGPGSSLLTVYKSIEAVSPSAVIMVGIAFGFDNEADPIGTILIADRLLPYELQRVNKPDADHKIHLRGDRPRASSRLIDRFRTGAMRWSTSKVRFGLLFSGEKLIDNQHYRDQLRALEPEAIGGEMEGVGLYVASQDKKVDWILVKAICDWASDKEVHKAEYQQEAAGNAARFVLHVLQQGGLSTS